MHAGYALQAKSGSASDILNTAVDAFLSREFDQCAVSDATTTTTLAPTTTTPAPITTTTTTTLAPTTTTKPTTLAPTTTTKPTTQKATTTAPAPSTTAPPSAALEVECKPLHGQDEGDATVVVLQAASGSCSAVADRINAIMTACPQIKGTYNQKKGATCSDTAEGGSNMLVWAKGSLNRKANLALGAFYNAAGTKKGKLLEKKPKRGSTTEKLLAAHKENKKGAKCKAIATSLNAMLADASFKCAA